jgi:hypothetical protein
VTEDGGTANERHLPERLRNCIGHRDDATASALRRVDNISPDSALDDDLTATEIDVLGSQPHHLACTQPRVASEENNEERAPIEGSRRVHEPPILGELVELRHQVGDLEELDRARHRADHLPLDRQPKGLAENGEDVVHRLRRLVGEIRLELLRELVRDPVEPSPSGLRRRPRVAAAPSRGSPSDGSSR